MENVNADMISLNKTGFLPILKRHGHELIANTFTNTLTNNQLADLIEEVANDMKSDKSGKYKKLRLTLKDLMHYISKNLDREKYAPLIEPYCIDFMRNSINFNNHIFNTNV